MFDDIHISITEFRCPHCHKLPPDIYSNIYYHTLFHKWERIREHWGRPIPISKSGGWRCPRFVYRMIVEKRAKAAVSPHSFGAIDSDLATKKEVYEFVEITEELFPELRIGFEGYLEAGMTFVHIDACYEVSPRASDSWVKGYRF